MYFGTTVAPEDAFECLDAAREVGATFWDTANNYAFWVGGTGDESESALGEWFTARGAGARDQITVATKIGARPLPGGDTVAQSLGLSGPAVREQVTDSLRRLRTEWIDLLYAHIDDRSVPLAETLGTLGELVEEGLVREIGASNLVPARLREALAVESPYPYRALQQRFTYLVPDADVDLAPHVLLDEEIEELCTETGTAMLGYSSLLSGAYTRPERPLPDGYSGPATDRALHALQSAADAVGLDAGQAVLGWCTQRDRPVLPVVGVSRPGQVVSAWQAISTAMPAGVVADLDRARTP